MNRVLSSWRSAAVTSFFGLSLIASGQQEKHGRGYKPPPPTAEVTVTVQKAFNSKPLPNASVIFRATREGKLNGNLETKTDPEGRAALDLLEVGSHVTVQVIAGGYATYATEFDLTGDGKQVLVELQRPRAQVSHYGDGVDRASPVKPGTQEHTVPKPASPTSVPPTSASPTSPLQTTPPAQTPATTPPVSPQGMQQ
jgi:hypothetical protein